jgi:hypothetical protein
MRNLMSFYRECVRESLSRSWNAANGIVGGLVSAAMTSAFPINLVQDGFIIPNSVIAFLIYFVAAYVLTFVFGFFFISPFLAWNRERQHRKEAESKLDDGGLHHLYPDVRVADNPSIIGLFSGSDRAKLLSLLSEGVIYSWIRPSKGSTDFVRWKGAEWRNYSFSFLPKAPSPGTINQTFIKPKSYMMDDFFDLCLNSKQLKRVWPDLDVQTSKCDVL